MLAENFDYDMAVIGGGSGGYAAARTAAAAGKKVVVIDGADELGGLCILRGCMPSKALIESANRNLAMRESEEFGLSHENAKVDMRTVIERKRYLIKDFSDYRAEQLQDGRFDLLRGFARFTDAHHLEVQLKESGAMESLSARTIIVATGSSIFVPEIEGLQDCGYITSDDILDMQELPDSIVVLGGGAIALEMAHYLEGLGKEVTVVQRSPHLLTGMDTDLADELEAALTARTMKIHTGTSLQRFEPSSAGKKRVVFVRDGEEEVVEADEILLALGRVPNTVGMQLEQAGVELNKRGGIVVNQQMQSSIPHILACGDVCSPYELVHIAIEQGELAAENAMSLMSDQAAQLNEIDYRLKLYGIFTEPQVAAVGLSEAEVRASGIEPLVETHPFNDHGKSMIHGSKYGFVKLIGDPTTKEILGGSVVGPEAVELIHEIVVAMAFRATANQLAKIPHYHPTLSEIWTYPAEEIADA
ncbi:dihydrolipoyl dehydrogenase family protein [Rubritalea marina]|uniref:dihydrolipoyl dehydrogenase family protein n=1 Tax=Rubritalea marina TaxID=361055 RepID=UPI000363F3D9|nr:NAD(P)/FAD-dependent oxidoreductase [Rubritalea marina]